MRQNEISATQLICLLLNNLIPTSLVYAIEAEIGPDAWLAGLLGTAVSLGCALLYLKLADRFPGRTLIGINESVFGPWLGTTCSAVFFLFYLFIAFGTIQATTSFQKVFLLNTPSLFLSLIGTALSFLMVSCGLEVIARCSQIVIIIFQVPLMFLIAVLLIPDMQLPNFQPMFQTPFPLLFKVALRAAAFSFGTGLAYLMIFPHTRDRRHIFSAAAKAFAIGIGHHLLVNILLTLVFGPIAGYFFFPPLNAARLVNIGDVFTRLEAPAGIVIWLWLIFHQTMYAYNLTTAAGELFRLKSYRTLCLPLGILLSILSLQGFSNSIEEFEFALHFYQWLVLPFQYLIPLLTLLVAVIRKLPRGNN